MPLEKEKRKEKRTQLGREKRTQLGREKRRRRSAAFCLDETNGAYRYARNRKVTGRILRLGKP
jgi:hypothetical protein